MSYISTEYNSATSIVGYIITSMLPYIFFGGLAGLASDLLDKKKLMYIVNVINGLLIGVLLFLVYNDYLNLYFIYVISFVMTVLDLFLSPAKQSILPILISEDDLLKANSLLTGVNQVLRIVLPIFSGLVSFLLNLEIIFIADAISYILASFCIYKIYYKNKEIKKVEHLNIRNVLKELKLGLKYIIESKAILLILIISIMLNVISAPISNLTILFVQDVLKLGIKFFGILEGTLSAGFIMGSLVLNYISDKKVNDLYTIIVGCILLTLGMLSFSFSTLLPITLLSYFVIGISMCIINVAAMTIKQKFIPKEIMGRVLGIMDVIVMLFMSLSVGLTGILADYMGVRYIFIFSAIGMSLFSLLILLTKVNKVNNNT